MNFSLICPTKNRPDNVVKLIDNLENTVSSKNTIELLLIYDEEEPQWKDSTGFNFYIYSKPHSDFLNKDYYNYGASLAKGKYLWAIGDDVRFIVKGWDIILSERIELYLKNRPDRIAYISVYEEGSQSKHPCFPLITKEAFNALNMYFHPQLMSWGADRCLWELYSNPNINRVLRVPEIHIEHLSYHDNKAPCDDTAKSMRERFFRDPECHNKVSNYIVPQQIKFLEKCINERMV